MGERLRLAPEIVDADRWIGDHLAKTTTMGVTDNRASSTIRRPINGAAGEMVVGIHSAGARDAMGGYFGYRVTANNPSNPWNKWGGFGRPAKTNRTTLTATYKLKWRVQMKKGKGFAGMSREKIAAIGKKGGSSIAPEDRSFSRDPELAAKAGRKGGRSVAPENRAYSRNPELAREAGRKSALARRKKTDS